MPEYRYPGYGQTDANWLRYRPKTKGGYHGGNDNPAKPGTPVYAQHSGEIFRTGNIDGYGMSVVVKSRAPDGTVFYQLYGHLGPDPLPPPGTRVTADQPIPGAVIGTKEYVQGKGGLTTGPHLHREIISGRAPLHRDPQEGLGIYSSDITYKADPDTFDINRPAFPYQNGEPKPAPQPGPTTSSPQSPQMRPSLPSNASSIDNPGLGAAPQSSSGIAIPGAEGPTSLGGPSGPARLVPPAHLRAPVNAAPAADPTLAPLHFAPEAPRYSKRPSFPLEALLAPDRNRALDQWASGSRRKGASASLPSASTSLPGAVRSTAQIDPSNSDRSAADGLLGMIQDYMRSNGY